MVAPDVRELKVKSIEKVQVGDRVAGTNPIREQAEEVELDAATWRKLSFQLRKPNGPPLRVDLLRPIEWIEANGADLGKTIFLNLPEMGAVGDAEVKYLGTCPPIKSGKGTVVTGKFIHRSDGTDVVTLQLSGEDRGTGVTRNHPYWSQDRREFVRVGDLRVGESIDTAFGMRRVASVAPCKYAGLLYNLETLEHVYRAGYSGALVHNACGGVYTFRDMAGKAYYVGQTSNFARRIAQHTGNILLPGSTIQKIAMTGGKLAREVEEQHQIIQAGGIANLVNQRNPIGMARAYAIPTAAKKFLGYK